MNAMRCAKLFELLLTVGMSWYTAITTVLTCLEVITALADLVLNCMKTSTLAKVWRCIYFIKGLILNCLAYQASKVLLF